jgi:hypothetical protein
MAAWLGRLIATMGRPAASLQDSGSDLHQAVAVLEDDGLGSPCRDAMSHAAAGMLKRTAQHHPAFARLVSACGRVSGQRKPTLLACFAPPTVRTKARFMPVHRLCTWADRVLPLSPPGGAKRGALFAKWPGALDDLPDCKARIKRFQGAAGALMACQEMLQTRGLAAATVAPGAPLIDTLPTVASGHECRTSLAPQRGIATTVGRAHVGVPISADAIASLFGVGKRHGVGETPEAARLALRLPALCGTPTREAAEHGLGVRMGRQHAFTAACTSLTQQRREVLAHPGRLESLAREPDAPHVALIPRPKKWAKNGVTLYTKKRDGNDNGTPLAPPDESTVIENAGPPVCESIALTS